MDRSLFPELAEVHQRHLTFESSAKAEQIQRRWLDAAGFGVMSGLTLSLDPLDPLAVLLAAGWGYSRNGSWCELTATVSRTLADYTAGGVNYVCLVYTEVTSLPEARLSGASAADTRAVRSARVVVLTSADLATMSVNVPSSDDMSVDAYDRVVVCGAVVGGGEGVALVSANLMNAVMLSPPLLTATQPVIMTGVQVVSVADGTLLSAVNPTLPGQLVMTTVGSPATAVNLAWRAPGDAGPGVAVDLLLASTPVTLTSTSGHDLVVRYDRRLLPLSGGPVLTDTIDVSEFYSEPVPVSGARDAAHRSALAGAVVPSSSDPHGRDMTGMIARLTQSVLTGLYGGQGPTSQAQALIPQNVSSVASPLYSSRTFLWEVPLPDPSFLQRVRFYSAGSTLALEVTLNAQWLGGAWTADSALAASVKFEISGDGISVRTKPAGAVPWSDANWDTTSLSVAGTSGLVGTVKSNGALQLGANLPATVAGAAEPRVASTYRVELTLLRTLLWEMSPSAGALARARLYVSQSGGFPRNVEITWNARWDQALNAGAGQWVRDAAGQSTKFAVGVNELQYAQITAVAPWNDTAWTSTSAKVTAGGGSEIAKTLRLGTELTDTGGGDNTKPRTTVHVPSALGFERWLVSESVVDATYTSGRFGMRVYTYSDAFTFFQELAMGCHWDGAQWVADAPGTAGSTHLYRFTLGGVIKYTRETPYGAGWAENMDAAGFSTSLSGWTYADTAWGVVTTDGAGGIDAALTRTRNIQTVSVTNGTTINIDFEVPIKVPYGVLLTTDNGGVAYMTAQYENAVSASFDVRDGSGGFSGPGVRSFTFKVVSV